MKTERRLYWHFSPFQVLRFIVLLLVIASFVLLVFYPGAFGKVFAWLLGQISTFFKAFNDNLVL